MIHKIIGHGSNGSKGVMDYMLKEEDKKTPRKGAAVLRGDVETQAKLIDSLVGKFKQQYVTGVFSFEEHPDQITDEQKQELMDGAEETILAGLSPDRVSITWIEHTDKGRLELNYIVACVDLKHGRAFQPYLHHQDQERFNAFKDIQNIKHSYTDPNDPIKARNLAQSKNLPKDVAELKEVITQHIERLVTEGLVNNRDDVKQVLNDLGFELSRETNNSISVKRPDGGRNLKFTTAKDGGLYEINFRPDSTSEAEIREASERYRASAPERLGAVQAVYKRELERKREYHQKRHSRPRREQRAITKPVNPAFSKYTPYDGRYALTVPNPFTQTLRRRVERDKQNDRELYRADSTANREQRESNSVSNQVRLREMGSSRKHSSISNISLGHSDGELSNKKSDNTSSNNLQSESERSSHILSTRKGRLSDYEQTVIRPNTTSPSESTGNDKQTEPNARRQRQGYSSLEELARKVSNNADRATTTLAETLRATTEHNQRAEKNTIQLGETSQRTQSFIERHNVAVARLSEASNSTDRAYERVSGYDSTSRQANERYRELRERVGQFSDFTKQNNEQSRVAEAGAREISKATGELKLVQQQQKQQVRANQSYSPRMR